MQRISKIATSSAPIGGLNVADSLVAMPPTDATVLRNFFSQPYGLEIRRGNVRHATGLGAQVHTIIEHITAAQTSPAKLFAFAGDKMFDVTDPGNQARTPLLSTLSNAKWHGPAISNASGYNRILFNGVDNGIWIKNDFSIARITAAAVPGSPAAGELDGVDPKAIIGGAVHQKRIWLVQEGSTKAWYLAPEAISGTAQMFDFGSIFQRGGYLAAVATWTVDSGSGMDDLFVALSSRGEVAIYTGADPSSADSWALKGVFQIGDPLNMRSMIKIEGDLVIMTRFGLISMTEALRRGTPGEAGKGGAFLSRKVQYFIAQLAEDLPTEFGWEVLYWAGNNMVLINVPMLGGSGQLVMSTLTNGWSQFDNWDALCFALFNSQPVYGDRDGNIWRAWEGNTDNSIQVDATTITLGDPIYAEAQAAFNYFNSAAVVKHAKMVRPTILGSQSIQYAIAVNADFDYTAASSPGIADGVVGTLWDAGLWGQDKWSSAAKSTQHVWTSVAGIGSAFALRLAFHTAQPVLWAAYDIMYEEGIGI